MTTISPIDIHPRPQEWISMQITNALGNGIIAVRNPMLNSGEFPGDYQTREHYHGTVHNCQIYPGMLQAISACASKGYCGTSGTISLYEGSTLICTLRWDCPGQGRRNSLRKDSVNGNYSVSIGSFNIANGPIGEVNITIQRG